MIKNIFHFFDIGNYFLLIIEHGKYPVQLKKPYQLKSGRAFLII